MVNVVDSINDLLYSKKKEIKSEDFNVLFFKSPDYEDIFSNNKSFNFLHSNLKLFIDAYQLHCFSNEENILTKNNMGFDFNEKDIIDLKDVNSQKKILSLYSETKETIIPIKSIYSLLENEELINLSANFGIKFISQDEPYLSHLINNMISQITKSRYGNQKLGIRSSNKADEFALKMGPIFEKLNKEGFNSTRKKANELNRRKYETERGNSFTHNTVFQTYKRYLKLKAEKEKYKNLNNPSQLKPE